MQLNDTPIHLRYKYNHLFTAKRNRVELISDFPIGNDAEVISSLQVHPQGWCILSRNTSRDENTEVRTDHVYFQEILNHVITRYSFCDLFLL